MGVSMIQRNITNNLIPYHHDLEKLRNKRLFITGATGFFGKWLLHSIIAMNEELGLNINVWALSRDPQRFVTKYPCFAKEYIHFISGDIRIKLSLSEPFDYIIHAATPVEVSTTDDEIYSIIVDGTKNILEFAHQSKTSRVLYISSGAVYGKQPPEIEKMPETYKPVPESAYGRGKLEAESWCCASGIDMSIARCYAFIGPYLPLDKHFAIGNFISDVLQNKDIIIKGDGRPFRSYMYAVDLMVWLWIILLEGKNGAAYNVGGDQEVSILQLARLVASCAGDYSGHITVLQKGDDKQLAPRYVPDTTFARTTLGLHETYMLEEAIKSTIEYSKKLRDV